MHSEKDKKEDLIKKITENLKYVPISLEYFPNLMNEQNKDGFDTFITNEEFWRFLQALSNKQYFSTFEDISSTNKDSVLINDKEVNYDEKAFDFDEDEYSSFTAHVKKGKKHNCQNFIIKRENLNSNEGNNINSVLDTDISSIKINSILKNINNYHTTQMNFTQSPSSQNKNLPIGNNHLNNVPSQQFNNNTADDKNFEIFFDFYLKSNTLRTKNKQIIKNDIKIYTTYVNTKKLISCDLDKKLIGFIIENYYENFFDLCNHWIYQEYLHSGFQEDFIKRRYDSLLEEILSLIETKKNFFKPEELNEEWLFFISNLPKYTKRVVSHLEKANSGLTKKFCDECKLNKKDPVQLQAYKNIITYLLNFDNRQNREIAEHLLNQLLQIPRKAITSLLNPAIRHIAKFYLDEDFPYKNVIVDFAQSEFEELINTIEENENVIKSKLGLFLYICRYEPALIKYIPKVYSRTNEVSRCIIESTFNSIIKQNNELRSNNISDFIKNSNVDTVKILLALLENCEGKIDEFTKNEIFKFCEKEKAFLDKVLLILGDKLSEQDFHKFFILKKILYMNNSDNNIESIISKILTNTNFTERYLVPYEGIKDKSLLLLYNLHISYKALIYNTNAEYNNMTFLNNFKTICRYLIKSFCNDKKDNLNESLSQFLEILIKVEDLPVFFVSILSNFLEVVADPKIILGIYFIYSR